MLKVNLLFALLTASLGASSGYNCYVPGECTRSPVIDWLPSNYKEDCLEVRKSFLYVTFFMLTQNILQNCLDNDDCNFFTHYSDPENECLLFRNCTNFSADSCENCVSGERVCSKIDCFVVHDSSNIFKYIILAIWINSS